MERQPERGDPGYRQGDALPQDREVWSEAGILIPVQIVPLGRNERELVEDLASLLGRRLRTGARIQDVAFNIERFLDPQRLQYNSTNILTALGHLMPRVNGGNRSKVLAVSGEDLFIPILTYVFGEAQLGGEFAVVSYHRLQPERYGLAADRNLLLDRLFKESLHELGHTYGLVHCQDQDCVMRTSTYAEDIDLKGGSFCRRCQVALGLAGQRP